MASASKTLSDLFSDYKGWVCRNSTKIKNWEKTFLAFANLLLGRFGDSQLQQEWLRSASHILTLFNNLILIHSSTQKSFGTIDKIKICINALENCEVALEKSVEHIWREKGRWSMVANLQMLKFVAKLTLVLYFKQKIVFYPYTDACASSYQIWCNGPIGYLDFHQKSNNAFKLKRSGKVIRKIESAPPLCHRLWKPPSADFSDNISLQLTDEQVQLMLLLGELLYIVKPVIILGIVKKYGYNSWRQWTTSLMLDLLSLGLIHYSKKEPNIARQLAPIELEEISQRQQSLLKYLLRSPFYDWKTAGPLEAVLNSIPFAGHFIKRQLDFCLSSYLFLWSK